MRFDLEKLLSPVNASRQRENLVFSYKRILSEHYGEEEILKKTPSDVMGLVTGLPSQTFLLNNYTIEELEDPRIVSDQAISSILVHTRQKYNILTEDILGQKKYSFKSFNNTYYWVPQDALP